MKKIRLTKGKYALVDDEDFERVNAYNWYASLESRGTKWYAVRWETIFGRRVKIRMSRFILGLPPGKFDSTDLIVDHLNHDSLDNRKENLESTDQATNMARSEGWKKKKVEVEPWL